MVEVEQYIILALALSGVLGVIGAASHPALLREGQMAIGVLCLFTLAVPITGALPSLLELSRSETAEIEVSGDGAFKETVEEAFTEGVREYVASQYGLDISDVSVKVYELDGSSMRAERITVTLSGRAVLANAVAIRESVCSELVSDGGECKVVIDVDG